MKLDLNVLFSISITAALAVIGFLIKVLFEGIKTRIETVETTSTEIKDNYIAKFAETNTNIQLLGEKITTKFDEKIDHLTDKMEKNYVTKEFCKAIHRSENESTI